MGGKTITTESTKIFNSRMRKGYCQGASQERIRSTRAFIDAGITTLEQITLSNLYTKE